MEPKRNAATAENMGASLARCLSLTSREAPSSLLVLLKVRWDSAPDLPSIRIEVMPEKMVVVE